MSAQQELLQLKERLQKQISVLEAEMATVDKAIQLLDREGKFATTTPTTGNARNSVESRDSRVTHSTTPFSV
jgi:hypothetical protein